MSFSPEQQTAFNLFCQRKNVFITGPGGVGKSYLIHKMVQHAHSNSSTIQVCALTGCAATILGFGAKTIHSWSGIGMLRDDVADDVIISRIVKGFASKNWKNVDTLVIDEVSMMNDRMFNLLDKIGRTVRRNNNYPFGGIQIIFTGDFMQLPPISIGKEAVFCFESPQWFKTFRIENHVELKTSFRQTDDDFREILHQIRFNKMTPETVETLKHYMNRKLPDGEIAITKIFPTRNPVDQYNKIMYDKLTTEEIVLGCKAENKCQLYLYSGTPIESTVISRCNRMSSDDIQREIDRMVSASDIRAEFRVKKGTVVMCTHNIAVEEGICNGSQGIITDFKDNHPVIRFTNGKDYVMKPVQVQSSDYPKITISHYPLCYAWALTIHKIQGATLDQAEIDVGHSIFEYGQTYVALSRVRSLSGLYLINFNPSKVKSNPKVVAFYQQVFPQ